MLRTLRPAGGVAALAVITLALPPPARAVPAFARQTGTSCTACHYQHFPSLTAFGQSFKAANYAQLGGQSVVEGQFLSLPSVLNLSLVFKTKYVTTPKQDELMFPDEAAFFAGGRVGKNIGFLLEGQLADQSAPLFASFKLPIGFEVAGGTLSVIPFTTDGLGTAFGFELLNTGAVRNVRAFEERTAISAQQYVVGLGGGLQWWGGQVGKVDRGANAWALDFQAQGLAGTLPLGVYVTYARAPGTPVGAAPSDTNIFNLGPNAQAAFAAAGELGVVPYRLTLGAGYRIGETGAVTAASDRAMTLSSTFLLTQNLALHLSQTFYDGGAWAGRADDRKGEPDTVRGILTEGRKVGRLEGWKGSTPVTFRLSNLPRRLPHVLAP
jgi:hypothetical protein